MWNPGSYTIARKFSNSRALPSSNRNFLSRLTPQMGLAQNAVCVLMNDVLTSSCIFRPLTAEKTQSNEGSKKHYVSLTQRALFNVYNEVYLRLKINIYMYIKHDLNYIHRIVPHTITPEFSFPITKQQKMGDEG